ncbi:retinoid-inducible serine carboxypeptidase-like [Tribolium castaneum]|uniref:Carboxypeptidase n=1 Tax=Tribolium castaneum TaxID=7070 RepID=D6W8Z9_TRICA|nr:Retinoid-inducible serine carboxypeptidase-like Protein [Tribolium castaneum]
MKTFLFGLLFVTAVLARKGFGPTEQEWGFVQVRAGAKIFWWLHQTSANVTNYTERPLVIWLQGGPGASSTGYGNFAELGPLDADLNPRNTTWINEYNVLFVDNPVGCGFSKVDDPKYFVTTNVQIAADFVVFLKGFFEAVPDLKKTPFYIFSESYGGKMTTDIALEIDAAIKSGELDANLVGIGLGDSWISPIDSVPSWGPYLLSVGAIDQNQYEQLQEAAEKATKAMEEGRYSDATNLVNQVEMLIQVVTANIDVYNILTKIPSSWSFKKNLIMPVNDDVDDKISIIMNNQVKEALGLNVTWGDQSEGVSDALHDDIMKPVVEAVETILNTTNIQIAVYNGQLDMIVDTPGTMKWLNNLQFSGSKDWKTAERKTIAVNDIVEGYYKKVGNLAMYWVDRAGHMVPRDNPAGMSFILQDMTSGPWTNN